MSEIVLSDNNFQVLMEEVDGNKWVHFECTRFTISSMRLILTSIDSIVEQHGSLYGSIQHNNNRMRDMAVRCGFNHICNIRTSDGVRSIYIRE